MEQGLTQEQRRIAAVQIAVQSQSWHLEAHLVQEALLLWKGCYSLRTQEFPPEQMSDPSPQWW